MNGGIDYEQLAQAIDLHLLPRALVAALAEQGLMILAEDDVRELVRGYGGFKDQPAYLRARHMLPENQENP
jgi:hypothetical protein